MKRFRFGASALAIFLASLAPAAEAGEYFTTTDACHHLVPDGALVRHPSGEVYLDGRLIATYPDAACTAMLAAEATAQPDTCGESFYPCTSNAVCCAKHECGWYLNDCWDSFWATFIKGYACSSCEPYLQSPPEYDYFSQSIDVPSTPDNYKDVNYELFWNALYYSNSSGTLILQPEIYYNGAQYGATSPWQVRSEAYNNEWDDQVGNGPDFNIAEGDVVYFSVELTGGGGGDGQTEDWTIVSYDANNGVSTTLYEELTGFSPLNQALDVYEVHSLASCAGTPTQNTLDFHMLGLTQAGNSAGGGPLAYINVSGVQTWAGEPNTANYPSCSWGASTSTGTSNNHLTWTE